MKKLAFLFPLIVSAFLFQTACTAVNQNAAEGATFSDPYAYCAAVGQIDAPDARYTGPRLPETLFADYLASAGLNAPDEYPAAFREMTTWRCMAGKVYVCNFGANIPCDSKANTDQEPTQAMQEFCTQYPDEPFIPMSVTGHDVVYSWSCSQGQPQLGEQISAVDAAGYAENFWQLVEPGQ